MSLINNILKSILPATFLKEAFLVYNKARIVTIDKVLFPEFAISQHNFLVYRKGYPFRENEIDVNGLEDDEVRKLMEYWHDWTQEEFLLILDRKCWIEPDYGWCIISPNKLVYYSLGISRTWFQRKPSLIRFLLKKNVVHFSKVISLRDTGEENYFHFYNDVLAKLFFLQVHGLDVTTVPVVVSERLWKKEYFQTCLSRLPLLRTLTWIVQEKQYISCDQLILCKPITHNKFIWTSIIKPLLSPDQRESRKIFLTRGKSRLRFIENKEVIEKIAVNSGLTIVDTDQLSLADQIRLFSEVSILVGIHGAGLTNMAFRKGNCRVLEIFPPATSGYLPFHYIMLAQMHGFFYQALIGETEKRIYTGGFYLHPQKFEEALSNLLAG